MTTSGTALGTSRNAQVVDADVMTLPRRRKWISYGSTSGAPTERARDARRPSPVGCSRRLLREDTRCARLVGIL